MRIPVFARRSNPAVDLPIVRKSLSYAENQVRDLLAQWVNESDHSKGIVARELLPRSEPFFAPEPVNWNPALPPVEVHGCHFEDPELSGEKLAERARLVLEARMISHFGPEKEFCSL